MDQFDQVLGWQRLDRRMLLVHPVRELGRYFVPLLLVVLFRRGSSGGGRWELLFLAIPIGLGILRYVTTSYRLTSGRVEVRSGLLNKRVVSTPLDRVRTVDLTASPIHRALGLVTLRVGTGQSGDKGDTKLDLDGLSVAEADQLRSRLLRVSPAGDAEEQQAPRRRVVLTLDPRWVRFAPLTSAGVVIAGAALGLVAQGLRTFEWAPTVDEHELQRLGVTVLVLGGLATVVVVLWLLAGVGGLVTHFGFVLH